jgi:hypothetical protein
MSAIKLSTPSSGSISLSPADTASNLTITVPANAGTMITTGSTFAGTGPAFSAYAGATTNLSTNAYTKILFNTEEFDTNSNYDTSTSRFTPTVAGYYQIVGAAECNSDAQAYYNCAVYKNGSSYKFGNTNATNGTYRNQVTCLAYLNGLTDYIEIYVFTNGSGRFVNNLSVSTFFQGALVRAA